MNRWIVGLFVVCAGCATSAGGDLNAVVKSKAAFDLSCTPDQVAVTEMVGGGQAMSNGFAATNQKSFGAEGCGKRASYMAWCTNMMGSSSCQAMQTGAPMASPAAAAPAAPAAAPAAPAAAPAK